MLDNLQYESRSFFENVNLVKICVLLVASAIFLILSYYFAKKENKNLSVASLSASTVLTCLLLCFMPLPSVAVMEAPELTAIFFAMGTCLLRFVEGCFMHEKNNNLISVGIIINLAYIIIFACLYI